MHQHSASSVQSDRGSPIFSNSIRSRGRGIEYLSHANAAGDKVLRMSAGNLSGSRWGLRGVEDLGSGTKAVYVLESGFDLDSGVSTLGSRLFGRQAFVGLENTLGRITLGRQQNALFDLMINYDAVGMAARYSALMMDPSFAARYDNTVKYTGVFGPVTAVALYSFARGTAVASGTTTTFGTETPGDVKSDTAFGGGLEYSAGPVGVSLVYDQQQGTRGVAAQNSGQRNRRIAAATSFAFGDSTVLAGYRWFNGDIGVTAGAPAQRNDVYWLGYRYQVNPALRLTASGYYFNDKRSNQDPWSLVASATYALSKRTDVALIFGYARNRNNSNLGLNGFGSTITLGENQTGVVASLRHKF